VEQTKQICAQCSQVISSEDTITVGPGRLAHLDCERPRILNAEERVLLFMYCRDHLVLCVTCNARFHLWQLGLDFGRRTHFCPWCRRDLTDSVREHLYLCALLPESVRRAAKAARDTARILVKETQQRRATADMLMREAEAAVAALRETLRQPPTRRT
jgi:hypothetical protein